MLLDLEHIIRKYHLPVTGVLHIGAHLAQEADDYAQLDVPVWWVEANPAVIVKLKNTLSHYRNHHLIQGLVADTVGEKRTFHVTNHDGMSSSLFEFDRHPLYSPETVFVDHLELETTTVDRIVEMNDVKANYLYLDIQGAELLALQGATNLIPNLCAIYTEVSTASVYKDAAQMQQIDAYLPDFSREVTDLGMHGGTHGDALYVRTR